MRETLLGILALALLCAPSARADGAGNSCADAIDWTRPVVPKPLSMIQLVAVSGRKNTPTNLQLLPVIIAQVAQNGQKSGLASWFDVYSFTEHPPINVPQVGGHSFLPVPFMEMNPAVVVLAGKPSTPGGPRPIEADGNPYPIDFSGTLPGTGLNGSVRFGERLNVYGTVEIGGNERGDGYLFAADADVTILRARLGTNGPVVGVLAHTGSSLSQSQLLSGTQVSGRAGGGLSLTVPTRDPKVPLRMFVVGGPEATKRSIGTPVEENVVGPSFMAGAELVFF